MSDKKKPEEDFITSIGSIEHALTRAGGEDELIVIPDELPVLTLRNTVLFPGSIVPLGIGRPKTVRLVEEGIKDNVAQPYPVCGHCKRNFNKRIAAEAIWERVQPIFMAR